MKIKSKIEKELRRYADSLDKTYRLSSLSPLLLKSIKEFILRDGKRVRPVLFCIGYLGYAKKAAPGLYRGALALELLHDFMLVHDDIIDKSPTRRGKPSMHALLGADLAIVTGDVIYALALDVFCAVKENPVRKERALRKLISAALFTASGEFIELLLDAKPIENVTQADIYKIYDYKTANYTFSSPLTMGAILAGAKENEIKKLLNYGLRLGRAFQIKDDLIGAFGKESETGKSNFTDFEAAKKTLLIWRAYNKSGAKDKKIIKEVFAGKSTRQEGLKNMRRVIKDSGALDYAKNQINGLIKQAQNSIGSLSMRGAWRKTLDEFSKKILNVK